MIKNSVFINNVDLADLGMGILKDGANDLLTYPARKTPTTNNWYEESYVDVDLTSACFEARQINLSFYIIATSSTAYQANLNRFFSLITQPKVILKNNYLGLTLTLRYESNQEYEHTGGWVKSGKKVGKLTVKFSHDYPLEFLSNTKTLVPQAVFNLGVKFNHVSIGIYDSEAFGLIIQECYSSILGLGAIKSPLVQYYAKMDGVIAHGANKAKLESKEIVLTCRMVAPTKNDFYWNYQALFNQLAPSSAVKIRTKISTILCYYSKMEDFKIHDFNSRIAVSFTLKFIQIGIA